MKRALITLLLLLAACREAKQDDYIKIRYYPSLPQHPEETIEGAAEILGMEIIVLPEERIREWGILVELREVADNVSGSTFYLGRCARTVWVRDNARSLAHELAHAMSLGHVPDKENLMYPDASGGELLTPKQDEQMRKGAWVINHCGLFQGKTRKGK